MKKFLIFIVSNLFLCNVFADSAAQLEISPPSKESAITVNDIPPIYSNTVTVKPVAIAPKITTEITTAPGAVYNPTQYYPSNPTQSSNIPANSNNPTIPPSSPQNMNNPNNQRSLTPNTPINPTITNPPVVNPQAPINNQNQFAPQNQMNTPQQPSGFSTGR